MRTRFTCFWRSLLFNLYAIWLSVGRAPSHPQRTRLKRLHDAAARAQTMADQERRFGCQSCIPWPALILGVLILISSVALMSRRNPPASPPWAPAACPAVHGVTVASGGYDQLAIEAASRWRRHTGLPATIVTADVSPGYSVKLWLAEMFPNRRVVFFDADLWLMSRPDMGLFEVAPFAACWDPGTVDSRCFTYYDARIRGLTPETYFNSGFFVADFREPKVQAMFARAGGMLAELSEKDPGRPQDQGEQSALNWAAADVGLPWHRLPDSFNFFTAAWHAGNVEIPRPIVGMHAAAVSGQDAKLAHLRAAEALFANDPLAYANRR